MADAFSGFAAGLESPAFSAAAVTPHDVNDLAFVTRGLYVGGGGDIALIAKADAAAAVFRSVPAGSILPVSAKRVLATGTTATNIVAMW